MHAVHWRSAVVEPNAERPSPTAHVDHVTHAWLPELALKVPFGHREHLRSLLVVYDAVSYSPAAHVVMSWHTRSDVVVDAVKINWWLAHSVCALQPRSRSALGATVSYSVSVHCVTATHVLPSFTLEYVELATHAAHWRSVASVPALD